MTSQYLRDLIFL